MAQCGSIQQHFLSTWIRRRRPRKSRTRLNDRNPRYRSSRRQFHDYFVTHLPSSSLHPDSRSATGLAHKFPRSDSKPLTQTPNVAPAAHPSVSRETTVVRIPLRSAKHHFGVSMSRGTRPYNEDSYQAGVIELPAFAKRPPASITKNRNEAGSVAGSGGGGGGGSGKGFANSDPQVFYFGVFDGHGGAECSGYLREQLHSYLERTAADFEMQSSLHRRVARDPAGPAPGRYEGDVDEVERGREALKSIEITEENEVSTTTGSVDDGRPQGAKDVYHPPHPGDPPVIQEANKQKMKDMEKHLVTSWRKLVGGYFRRFKPAYFSLYNGKEALDETLAPDRARGVEPPMGVAVEEVVTYAFLRSDYDFVSAQAHKEGERQDMTRAERPLNYDDILEQPSVAAGQIGGPQRFKGGSTCSVALVSTPTPTPFWNPATPSSMLIAHVGDSRIILCSTATGAGIPLTTNHCPSSPVESNRLRRYAASFVTDSFGEERISGLANTRAFGDIASKRLGVSAEPEIKRVELGPAEYSFLVLISDGVSGTINDQEVVDIVKEAKTPEQAGRDVVSFAIEVSTEGDNATCLVVRLGGWERRQEGGVGSLGTKESRQWKRDLANDPRGRRQ